MNSVSIGRYGEEIAVEYLKSLGCEILKRNYVGAHGEIDVIAKKGSKLMFVEVKTRRNTNFGYPSDAVNYQKQRKIINAARAFVLKYKDYEEISFDVCEIYIDERKINYIDNAFVWE